MSTYRLELLEGEPIILVTIFEDYSIARDMPKSDQEGRALLETFDRPGYFITDITRLKPTVDDLIQGSNRGARGDDPLWKHPLVREMIFVSSSPFIQVAAKGMNTVTFGNLSVQVFKTVEEALVYCRAHLAE